MGHAALISAYQESAERGSPLRAMLPLAGRCLVERQARLAAGAGAELVVLLVERVPAGLAEAVDRLRRDRIRVQVARGLGEAAELLDNDDRILLVADGFVADPALFDRIGRIEGAALLTLDDGAGDDRYERIDAGARWAGLATLDGALLRATAAMLRDWDPQSTLLRRIVQSGARQIRADRAVVVAEREEDLVPVEQRMLEGGDVPSGWAERLLAPIERMAVARLMGGSLGPSAAGALAAALTGIGAFAFGRGVLWAGLAALLAATPLEGIAARLARLRMQDEAGTAWWKHLMPVLAGAALLALGYARAAEDGWGAILLAATTIAFLLALDFEREGREISGSTFLAERRGMAWLLLPFALAGAWTAGMALLFAYAAGSFFWAQHRIHHPPPEPKE